MKSWILLAATMLAATATTASHAQQGIPAFRVPIGGESASTGGSATYAWMETVGTCSSSCGTGTRTRTYQCQDVSSYDFSGSGYGAPEADASCTSARPSSSTTACTNYSGCSYDWVKPAATAVIQPKPNPAGGTFPAGAVVNCSFAKRTFAPYCQRDGNPAVTMPAGDHAFCRNDLPDYSGVASGDPDALGYDRSTDVESACVAGGRDNEWVYGAWNAWSSECSTTATRTRSAQCTRKFNGASLPEAQCAGLTKNDRDTQSVLTACTFKWNASAYGAYPDACSANATRTRTVDCRRSDGTTVADSQCSGDGPKPATSESGPVYTSCGYSWGTPSGWGAWANGCSSSTTRNRTVSCMRSDGTAVSDGSCANAGPKPATTENGPNYASCTYAPRDMGRGACTNGQINQYWDCTRSDGQTGFPANYCGKSNPEVQTCEIPYSYTPRDMGRGACSNGTQPQYWDCTRNDGQTGFPASMCGKSNPEYVNCPTNPPPSYTYYPVNRGETGCSNGTKTVYWDCTRNDGVTGFPASSCGKTNPETQSCPVNPPPSYTYYPVNRGETACSNGSKTVYWDCTRNDGATGFPASNCGKTNPETQSCPVTVTYTPRYQGESACSNGQKQVYWDCLGSNGSVAPASSCGKTNPETQSCPMPVTYSPRYQGESACSNGQKQVYWDCLGSDGSTAPASSCGKTSPETQGCTSFTWVVDGWSGYNSACSGSATRTRGVYCRGTDGQNYPDGNCASQGPKPASSETGPNYAQCTYSSEDASNGGCVGGVRTYTTQCRRSDGNIVANSNCGNDGTRTESCAMAYSWKAGAPTISGSGSRAIAWGNARGGAYGGLREWIYEESGPTGGYGITEYYNSAPAKSSITPACDASTNGTIRWRHQMFIDSNGTRLGQASGMTCSSGN